ncbi:hypothetical protein ACFQT0_01380 [Hymenobacter humi]|uniref:SBBP repeat-containing protein n=1 Tax=Hymenobacter humi TaxID=1411620 RepID=A0ABW2U026_9BACT
MATAVDDNGNVYVAGFFQGTASFGSITLTSQTDAPDVFVAKWSPFTNAFIWAQRAGGAHAERAMAIAVSGTNVYVFGEFLSPTASFGATTLFNSSSIVPGSTSSDLFVAKLTDEGSTSSFVWAQRAGSAWGDFATAMAVSGSSIYITGYFEGIYTLLGTNRFLNFGPDNTTDAFVAKLTDSGSSASVVWAQHIRGAAGSEQSLALAASGNSIYVAGWFGGPTVNLESQGLANGGGADGFVGKITDAGTSATFAWAQRISGSRDELVSALAVNGTNVYVTGFFNTDILPLGSTTLANAGIGTDVFVTKLTDTGNFVWGQHAGGTANDYARSIAVRGTDVYVAGDFSSDTARFGSTTLINTGSGTPWLRCLCNQAYRHRQFRLGAACREQWQ